MATNNDSVNSVQKEFRVIQLDQIIEPSEPVRQNLKLDQEGFTESVSSGQLSPINVRPLRNQFEIINGHRRFAALKAGKKTQADCMVWHGLTELDVKVMRLTENTDRADPDPIETAHALENILNESGMSYSELSKKINKSKAWIGNHLAILGTKYEKPVQSDRIKLDTAMIGQRFEGSKEANQLFIPTQVESITDKIIEERMSRPKAEQYIDETVKKQIKKRNPARCDSCSTKVYRDQSTLKNKFRNGKSIILCDSCYANYLDVDLKKKPSSLF